MKAKPKTIFVLRFAKAMVETPLYFSPYQGQFAVCPIFAKAIYWDTHKDAQDYRDAIVGAITDPDVREKINKDLEVEQHVIGDDRQ